MTQTLAAFIEERWRDDSRTASWTAGAIPAMWSACERAGLAPRAPEVTVVARPGASEAEVAGYAQRAGCSVPAELAEVWREVGPLTVTLGSTMLRWLSPGELASEGATLRDRVKKSLRKLHPEIDVLALEDDQPILLFDPRQTRAPRGEGQPRVWYHLPSGEPYHVLSWLICQQLNLKFKRALEARLGELYVLAVDEQLGPQTRRVYLESGQRFWEGIAHGPRLLTRSAKVGTAGKPALKELASADAARLQLEKAAAAARRKGYR